MVTIVGSPRSGSTLVATLGSGQSPKHDAKLVHQWLAESLYGDTYGEVAELMVPSKPHPNLKAEELILTLIKRFNLVDETLAHLRQHLARPGREGGE